MAIYFVSWSAAQEEREVKVLVVVWDLFLLHDVSCGLSANKHESSNRKRDNIAGRRLVFSIYSSSAAVLFVPCNVLTPVCTLYCGNLL